MARDRRTTAALAAVLATLVLAVAACGDDGGGSSDSAGGGGGTGPEKTSLKVGLIKIGDVLPFWVAEKQGYFKEAGFDSVQGTEMAEAPRSSPPCSRGSSTSAGRTTCR